MFEMQPIALFIASCAFLGTFGTMYILSEINLSTSSYGVRRRVDEQEYFDARYHSWFERKEDDLSVLYKQEVCESMKLSLEDFASAIYHGEFKIVYS